MQVISPQSIPLPKDVADAVNAAKERADVLRLEGERWQTIARNEERNAKASIATRLGEEEKIKKAQEVVANLERIKEKLLSEVEDLTDETTQAARALAELENAKEAAILETDKAKNEAVEIHKEIKAEKESVAAQRSKLESDQEAFNKKVAALKAAVDG